MISDASDLLKGDAGDAAAYLGGVECALTEEIKWGSSVVDVLEGGAEGEFRKARFFINALIDLENIFSGSTANVWDLEEICMRMCSVRIGSMNVCLNSEK